MRSVIVIGLVAVVVAAGLFFAGVFNPKIPDVNAPVGLNGEPSVGYFDATLTAQISWQNSDQQQLQGQNTRIAVSQHLNAPSGQVEGSFSTTATSYGCSAFARLYADGPGLAFAKDSDQRPIPCDATQITFKWGHVYAFQLGATYNLHFELYVAGSPGDYVQMDSDNFAMVFDGTSQT